ncbi:DUF488 domain-containing protein [Mycobacterium ostraviense]|uniref:MarR family transcriptional regulator n=1 Tax=Mycobacterium ostraviense TaxID=2738409 RepID=A0A164AGI3_9MYCO|nr:DUF488 family protein [Mycobacterium ostraviense]KZS62454.1 hypothetical protein A4G28_20610 [Mycobacterium ostraviense]UGT90166.1 DUF488 family protein [Mycobacterium ostraviense]
MVAKRQIRITRIYADPDADVGQRILVDGIWPRGIRKDDPRVGVWRKDVAPSTELREWYHHRRERFDEFEARYEAELSGGPALAELRKLAASGPITLVTATREIDGSHAAVLAKLLESR